MATATLPELVACIRNGDEPIAKRNRAIFMIKHVGGEEAVPAMTSAFPTESVLLNHEICYALG
jgi:hypothetical protein